MQIGLTDLGFLLKSAQNCKKCTFLDKLRAITQEGNLKTRQMTSFFIYFFYSVCIENSQNSFSSGLPFHPFWSVKSRKFQQKLPIWTTHHTFIKSILYIAHIWSLFCSVQVYLSLYFLPLQVCNFLLSLFYKNRFLSSLLHNFTDFAFEFCS